MKIEEIVKSFAAQMTMNQGAFVLIYGYNADGQAQLCLKSNVPRDQASGVLAQVFEPTEAAVETVKQTFTRLITATKAGTEVVDDDATLGAAALVLCRELLSKITFVQQQAAPPVSPIVT